MVGGMQSLRVLLCVLATTLATSGFAQESEFPLDSNLFLDARPMPGSKRIPNLEVRPDHSIVLELWCNRADGQVVVAGDTITIMVGQPTDRQCRPDQAQRDADLLAALNGVTNWRFEGDTLELVGPKTLRFKQETH
jgi:heat shock protein HslJ